MTRNSSRDEKTRAIKVVCNSCGHAFAAFLRDMAEQNTKVVCPACGVEYVKSKAADAVREFLRNHSGTE
jgi:predicted RNA-binding Zn-ribbon protein involved in translation (DUF1610 family)